MTSMPVLPLAPDQLLTTTRTVRRRLDVDRPVDRSVIEACLEIALQAPTGGNRQRWHFVVVTDAGKRAALAALYRKAWAVYLTMPTAAANLHFDDPAREATQRRVAESAQYLADTLDRVPVLLVPCFPGRVDGQPASVQAATWGSILPAVWSFMLAARARGLGTAWTTLHLLHEREAAEVLGIPHDEVTQAALIPVAYTRGTDFRPAHREPLARFLHWDAW
jgi:nitroreductase